jgi:serine/threonine protein kinase
MASKDLRGQIIDGSFRILSSLGEGGVGEVYLAEQLRLERKVAIKFLHDYLVGVPEWHERFLREGKILSRLLHPGIVRCFAYGVWQNKLPYLVFEYIEGETLKDLISTRGPLPWRYVFKLAAEICLALAYAHGFGVIHRDLKPDNIIVSGSEASPQVKILDFGLARLCGSDEQSTLTGTGRIVGSPHYMSPEQCLCKKPSICSDLYSLGCIMYESICGVLPLTAPVPAAILQKQVCEYPLPASSHIKKLPGAVDRVLMKAMAKKPEHRYGSAEKMAAELLRVLESDHEHELAAADILMPAGLSRELFLLSMRRRVTQHAPALLTTVFLSGLAIFVLSDPGPSVLFEAWAGTVPVKERCRVLESGGDFFMNCRRLKAAEILLAKARLQTNPDDEASAARLLGRLARCSFALHERSAAISRATEFLAITCIMGSKGKPVDYNEIVRVAAIIEELDAPCEPRLEQALRTLITGQAYAGRYDSVIHANLAMQSTPLPNRVSGRARFCLLVEGLQLAGEHNDRVAMERLVEHAMKRTRRLVSCIDSLQYFLTLAQNEIKSGANLSKSPGWLSRLFIQTLTCERAGSLLDRAEFAYYVLGLRNDLRIFCSPGAGLERLAESSAPPVLRGYASLLASFHCFVAQDYQQCRKLIKQALLLTGSLEPGDYTGKREIFEAECLIDRFPVKSREVIELARLKYAQAKAQGVSLPPELILQTARVLSCARPRPAGLRDELMALLQESRQGLTGNGRITSYFLSELIQCATAFQQNGEEVAQKEAIKILTECAKLAEAKEMAPYYNFLAFQCAAENPELAADYRRKADDSSLQELKKVLYTDIGKTNLH